MVASVVVIGCGSIGQRHLRNLADVGIERLVAVDPDPERRAAAAAVPGAETVASLDEAWQLEPRLAVVATPTARHLPDALAAAQHGCHLLVEKPLADSLDGLDALLEAASGSVTLVGCNLRFHPGPANVAALIAEGTLGTVLSARFVTGSYLPAWRPGTDYRLSYSASRAEGGGAVLDCIHELDLACWMLGPAAVAAAVTRPAESLGLDVEGLAEILLRHESGAVSSVHLNFVQRDYHRLCEVVGTKASAYWDASRGTVELRDDEKVVVHELPEETMYTDELRYLLECIAERRPTFNDLETARATLALALTARDGAEVAASTPSA
jgi:predicted dehydrogenase